MRPMSDTHHVQTSTGSVRSSQNIQDAYRKMEVNDGNGVAQSEPYPDRPGERDCQFYLRTGLCGYGSSCRYNHPTSLPQLMYYNEDLPERIGQPDCEYYLKTGACKYGSTCKYHHPKDRNGAEPVLFNVLSLPMRQGEKPCQYYMRTGTCRFGVACKFHHPQPDNGHSTAAASYGMPSFPSAGLHYAGGLTMMSTYGSLPRPQLPHSYVPVMVSPSQGGLLPPQSWATYMGASNSMYGVRNQPYYSGSSAPMPMAVSLSMHERSEQQHCRAFMNTGTCKYGEQCKYIHLGVRISPPPPPPNFINPFVLPARPGQPACGSFKSYGFCKFGPNCNYDHSMLPYPTGLTMHSSLPTPYASPVSDQRISPSPSRSGSKAMPNDKPDVKKEIPETDDSKQLKNSQVQDLSSPRS